MAGPTSNLSHPYINSRPTFSNSQVDVTIDGLNNTRFIPNNNIENLNISYNYNADSYASITIAKSDFLGTNYDFLTQTVVYDELFYKVSSDTKPTCNISIKYIDTSSFNPVQIEIFNFYGNIINITENSTSVTINISNNFNLKIKNGEVKELDFLTDDELKYIFNLTRPLKLEDYATYFEDAVKYNNAYYVTNSVGDIVRFVIDREKIEDLLKNSTQKLIPIDILDSASISPINGNLGSTIPNVYDIVLYVKFKRYNTLVKEINLSSTLNIPTGLRSTFTTNNSDGTTTTLYKTYDRPARISAIIEAAKSSGWTLGSNLSKSTINSNILDLDGSIIYTPLVGDDITDCSISFYREHVQDVSMPIILRIIDTKSITNSKKIIYKKLEKEYVYTSEKPSTILDNTSNYVDVFDWSGSSHMQYMESLKNRAVYEMGGNIDGLFNESCNLTFNFINTVSSRTTDMAINKFPPYPVRDDMYQEDMYLNYAKDIFRFNVAGIIKTPYNRYGIIFNKNINWSPTGDLKATYNIKHILIPDEIINDDPIPELPDMPVIEVTSAPHDAAGSGLLNVNGSSSDWADDTSWAFENDVTLSRYYNYYYNTSSLVENADPEQTKTNYYLQSVYVNKKVDTSTLPFQSTTSQCRIKNDKVKSVYTKAITLPPLVLTLVDINPPEI